METSYIESTIKKNKNIFKLSTYRSHTNKKPTVLQFPDKQALTEKINREKTPITSITAKEDLIFTGDSNGKIKMFSIDQECEIKSFINDNNNSKVISMDISDDKTTLLSGYSNGNIALWDLKFGKMKKLLKNEHENAILCCKFLLCNDYVTEFISSDYDGVVNKIILTQNFLFLNVNNINIIYYKVTPFYQIDILKLVEEKKYPCFQNFNPQIISIASTEIVFIIIIFINMNFSQQFSLKYIFLFIQFFHYLKL
jgi:WD40 repeat protein